MAKSVPARVNPRLLKWARESAGIDEAAAAKRTNRTADEIRSWEDGSSSPTVSQARKLASIYKRPLASFFLSQVPEGRPAPKDFRRLPTDSPRAFSAQLRLLLREIQNRQDWAREYRKASGFQELTWIGSARVNGIATLALKIRTDLLTESDAIQHGQPRAATLRDWISRVESRGVFVSQTGEVDPTEARGFALPDQWAPFIWINSKDSRSARVFSLLHELVHLYLGTASVSNPLSTGRYPAGAKRVEVFCNSVAAEVLVPSDEFAEQVGLYKDDLETSIGTIANYFGVSREVIARRLFDEGHLNKSKYESLRETYKEDWLRERERMRDREGGPPWSRRVVAARGRRFVRTVLTAYSNESILERDVAWLLGTGLQHLPEIESELASGD